LCEISWLAENFLNSSGIHGNQEDQYHCNWGRFWDFGGRFGNRFKWEFLSENYDLLRLCGIVVGGVGWGGAWMATEIVQILADSILLYNGAGGV
jgi:hypothetical protein